MICFAAVAPSSPLPFSWRVLVTLVVATGASAWVFAELVRRWTTGRRQTELYDWARSQRLRIRPLSPDDLPAALAKLGAKANIVIGDKTIAIAEVTFAHRGDAAESVPAGDPAPGGEGIVDSASADPATTATGTAAKPWRILALRSSKTAWTPAGLRPAHAHDSLIDLFALTDFPTLSSGQRFVVRSVDRGSASTLASNGAMALLPPDVGLLLGGPHLLLDFSARPFDPIEFERMIDVARGIEKKVSP